jgi:hypothetical protein
VHHEVQADEIDVDEIAALKIHVGLEE